MTHALRCMLCVVAVALAHPAAARERHHGWHRYSHHRVWRRWDWRWHHASGRHWGHRPHLVYRHRVARRACEGGGNVARARCLGLPWCGAFMADHFDIGGRLGRELWLARNWAILWGRRAAAAAPGEIAVWPHHVGLIVGRADGLWVVLSGNDGNRVRERPRSLAGVIAFRSR